MTPEQKKEFEEWYNSRPESIKALVDNYPPGTYTILPGAPYALSCAGTKVYINSYFESGIISVIVKAEDKLPEAIEHEARLCEIYGKDKQIAHDSDILARIDPRWLTPFKPVDSGSEQNTK